MPELLLIVVTGPPASGKSALARRLARDLGLPNITKDGIKETLYDSLGWTDRVCSRQLGGASYALLFHLADALLQGGASHILECNLRPAHADRLRALGQRRSHRLIQVHCWAPPEVLIARFRRRWRSGRRHPGHADDETLEELAEQIRQDAWPPLDLEGPLIRVDTTRRADRNHAEVLAAVRAAMAGSESPPTTAAGGRPAC